MTERMLLLWMADEFHDWIDGEDSVNEYTILDANRIWVEFESGEAFVISVRQINEDE